MVSIRTLTMSVIKKLLHELEHTFVNEISSNVLIFNCAFLSSVPGSLVMFAEVPNPA